jgi:carbonic anhydrase
MKTTHLLCAAAALAAGTSAALAAEAPHWTYEGAHGPAHWADLDPSYTTCAVGQYQSPIDLVAGGPETAAPIEVSYQPVALTVLNNGHTVQVTAEGAGRLQSAGTTYDLLQVHFHSPSEHLIDGRPVPVEAHFVHKAEDGRLAVLGVFVVEGAENPALAPLLSRMPVTATPAQTFPTVSIDLGALLPQDLSVYRYGGSLTTPPCTEGVAWHVLEAPVTASPLQIEQLSQVLDGNARPVQPLNGRPLIAPSL